MAGGGGLAFWLSLLRKLSFIRYAPFFPHRRSRTSMGSPNSKSNVHTWQIFLSLLHEEQTQVRLQTPLFPFHLKTVKGLKQMRHYCPQFSFSMRMQGFSPQHLSQATGKSDVYQPCLLIPVLVASPRQRFMPSYNINGAALHPIYHISYPYIHYHMNNRTVTGLMVFKQPIPQCYLEMMKEQNLEDIFQLEEWWLPEGTFEEETCQELFRMATQVRAKEMDLYDNYMPKATKSISHIAFPCLQRLIMTGNHIQSIEALVHLKSPSLQRLHLNCNLITEVKSLRKCNFPCLKVLTLSQNRIIDISFLSYINWSPEMKMIQLDSDNKEDRNFFIEGVTPILKSSIKLLQKLDWDYQGLAKNKPIRRMIGRKYAGILFYGKSQ